MKFTALSFLAAAAMTASSVSAEDAQRLVLFAGPTGATSTSIEAFYRHFASDATGPKHGSFNKWDWPNFPGPLVAKSGVDPDDALSLLVTADDKEDLQEEMMKHIEELWHRDDKPNIFMGSEELERIGLNPYTKYNALHAAKRVAQRLGVSHESIEVVINYRTPRLDQWISVWKHLAKESDEHYRQFLCTSHEINAKKVWEMLDTAMNPLKVAQKFRESDFRVTLVDMAHAKANERDVVHVIGCDVLGLHCGGNHPGWIDGLWKFTFFKAHEDREYPNFTSKQKDDLEATFRNRDCYFQNSLANDSSLRLVNADKASIWSDCHKEMSEEYSRLVDTTFLYNQLRHQHQCAEEDLTQGFITGVISVEKDGEEQVDVPAAEDAKTVEEKEDVIEGLEEKKEAIKEEAKQIEEEEQEINEQIGEQEDSAGGSAAGDVTEAQDTNAEIEAVQKEIDENPNGEAAEAAKPEDGEEAEYKSPDASGSAAGVAVPVLAVVAVLGLILVRRRRASARQSLPVEFASVDEEFGDATMEDMQPRYVD